MTLYVTYMHVVQVARNCYNYKAIQLTRQPECIAAIQSVQANGQAAMEWLAQELAEEQAAQTKQAAVVHESPRTRSVKSHIAVTDCHAKPSGWFLRPRLMLKQELPEQGSRSSIR